MSWINDGHFKIADRNNRHYVFRRTNAGNTEINIPKNIVTKGRAKAWLKANPNKVKNPTSYKAKNVVRKITPGKLVVFSPKPSNINFKCNTTFFKKVRASNGATGYKATILANRNKLYSVMNSRIPVTKGMGKLGKGSQGVVFLAYTSPKGIYPVTIKVIPRDKTMKKQTSDTEFDIQQKLYSIVPGSIPQPYKLIHGCKAFVPVSTWGIDNKSSTFDYSDQTVLFTEYITGGSLPDWMERMNGRLSDAFMQSLISQILHTLLFIGKRLPSFRHNDLHLDNILVKQSAYTKFPTFILNDFGWASIGRGSNPLVNSNKHSERFGIGAKTSGRYDMHLFLNELHKWMEVHGGRAKYPKAIAFIEKHVPAGYLGSRNTYISESRLKYGIPYPGLSSLSDIVKDPYVLSPKKFIRNVMNMLEIKKKQDAIFKSTRNIEKFQNTPRTRALIRQMMNKNISPSKNMKLSPRSFLKLSPQSRAALMMKPRGLPGQSQGVIVVNKTMVRGKPIERQVIRMVGGARGISLLPFSGQMKPRVASPKKNSAKRNIELTKSMLRSSKFNKLRVKLTSPGNNASYYDRFNMAKAKAINVVKNRLRKGLPAFTPTPPRVSPPKPAAAQRLKYRVTYTPETGRMKIVGNSGRLALVNGSGVSMDHLRAIAANYGIDIRGLRSKVSIANKIFRNSK